MYKETENIDHIIGGCKNQDRRSQELLYRSFYRVMMKLCLRYTKNEHEAMEVLNIGFYKVFKNINRYDPRQASLYTWIRTIIINSCLDHLKPAQSKQNQELGVAEEVEISPQVISDLNAEEILELVRQLPPATAAVFNLYVIEGYSHKEIGKLLSITDGTSKWHLSEARKFLQKKLNRNKH